LEIELEKSMNKMLRCEYCIKFKRIIALLKHFEKLYLGWGNYSDKFDEKRRLYMNEFITHLEEHLKGMKETKK